MRLEYALKRWAEMWVARRIEGRLTEEAECEITILRAATAGQLRTVAEVREALRALARYTEDSKTQPQTEYEHGFVAGARATVKAISRRLGIEEADDE